jgi:hypothetical protein
MARRPDSTSVTRHPSQLLALAIGVICNSDINFLSINGADNGLHLVSAAAGLAIALWPANRTVPGTADRST